MKKLTGILLIFILTLGMLLTGCSSSGEKAAQSNSSQSKESGSGEKLEAKDIKVGFLYVGPVGDGGYSYAHDQGRIYMEKELGLQPSIVKESVPEDDAEVQNVIASMIDEGANVIIGTSFGFMNGMKKAAQEYPDVKFLHCSGNQTAENMSNYFGRMYQARYLSGIVAGMKTKSNIIGYVGAFEMPEVVRGLNAFTLGVRSVNPKAVVKIKYTNTWYDPAKEKEAAKALLDEGADVIAQHQDTAGPQQAAEERGAFSIGYNTDMQNSAPNANMTSAVWNWGKFYVEQVKAIIDGTWKSGSYWDGMETGIVDLAPLTKNAPEGAEEKVKKAKEDIISGKNKIFVGPIKDNKGKERVAEGKVMTDEELLNFDWYVEGVRNGGK
ncbi:MAG: BMP family ABC transporter substrate-binding protein [Clostridium thermopalmarium]|uniref:BMP family ABC transporter substrate-binding protein n=1 Tax=Clostridium thermopalmarium TaxID=29373 RepID=UPI0023575EBF|nr:BMP family ABC transporter substrate-binding protein [Clostridium thermopalmarium]MBE6042961.1 BMP family ABC transporter substrate-binding protein [Clostridium thermopalmarium]